MNIEKGNGSKGVTYYHAISLPGIGYWKFPNPDIFPFQLLRNMTVGTGDGSTVEFKCPLNYFVKDTDIVKINGVAMTREVDYQIDNNNNADLLPELTPGNFAIWSGEPESQASAEQYYSGRPFFRDYIVTEQLQNLVFSNLNIKGFNFRADQPFYADCKESMKVNYLLLTHVQATNTTASFTASFTLSYSNDNTVWIDALTITGDPTTLGLEGRFETVSARYWKLSTTWSSEKYYLYQRQEGKSILGYIGHGIVFTTPPAAGDVITMDAQLDRPMKNENFVIDLAMEIYI